MGKTFVPTAVSERDRRLTRLFDALGDASRFHIFKILLASKDICVSELAKQLHITVSAVSQHLKILELNGLVEPHRRGQMICYQVKRRDEVVKRIIRLFDSELRN